LKKLKPIAVLNTVFAIAYTICIIYPFINAHLSAIAVLNTVFAIAYTICIIYPFINAHLSEVSFDSQVDPTYMNGLLTASSILFGFSALLVIGERPTEKILWWILVIPLIFIVFSGGQISSVALGTANEVFALLMLTSTFNTNILSVSFLTGYKYAIWFTRTK